MSFRRLRVIFLDEINLLANLKAINLRHLNIGQHDLVGGLATPRRQLHSEEPDSFPAREARSELDLLGLKHSLQRNQIERDIIDHQHLLTAHLAAHSLIQRFLLLKGVTLQLLEAKQAVNHNMTFSKKVKLIDIIIKISWELPLTPQFFNLLLSNTLYNAPKLKFAED